MDLAQELCHRVTFQHFVSGRDEYNYETDPMWAEFKKLWAKIDFLSVKDSINAKAANSQTTARLKLRKRSDITTEMRVLWGGYTFQIVSPPKPDNANGKIYMTLELAVLE